MQPGRDSALASAGANVAPNVGNAAMIKCAEPLRAHCSKSVHESLRRPLAEPNPDSAMAASLHRIHRLACISTWPRASAAIYMHTFIAGHYSSNWLVLSECRKHPALVGLPYPIHDWQSICGQPRFEVLPETSSVPNSWCHCHVYGNGTSLLSKVLCASYAVLIAQVF